VTTSGRQTFRLTVAYLGAGFCGWQSQKNAASPSLQAEIEKALACVLDEKVRINASGRTDAGVHALGQVFAFQTTAHRSPEAIRSGLNSLLPESIRVCSAEKTSPDFHPQHCVRQKTYRYLIQNSRSASPFLRPFVWPFSEKLDTEKMRRAADCLVGRHDFASFQDSGRKAKDTVRTIFGLDVKKITDPVFQTEDLIEIRITGEGFLYKMVRNIVGTLVEAGRGRLKPEAIKAVLKSRDRRKAGPTAPACGLTLLHVEY